MTDRPDTDRVTPDVMPAPRMTTAVQALLLAATALVVLQDTILAPVDVQRVLGFSASTFAVQWWTILTFTLVHTGAWHLVLNGYVLWLFGPRLEARWGAWAFTRFYIIAALGGWFTHLVGGSATATLIGSTAPTLGVMVAYTHFWGRESTHLFGMVPTTVRWLAALMGGILLLDGVSSTEVGTGLGYLAHAGGAVAAWIALRAVAPAVIERLRQSVSAIPDDTDEDMPRAVPRPSRRVPPRARSARDDRTPSEQSEQATHPEPRSMGPSPQPVPEALDRLLDKIARHGLESLSSVERAWLDEAARNLRDGGARDGHSDRQFPNSN